MNTDKSMFEYFRSGKANGNDTKIIYYGRHITFGNMCKDIYLLSGLLQYEGIKKGNVVAIMLPNIPEAVLSLYAVNNVGAICNLIHPKMQAQALEKLLIKTQTKAIFLYDKLYKYHKNTFKKLNIKVIICSVSNYMQGIKKLALSLTEPYIKDNVIFFNDIKKQYKYIPVTVSGKDSAVYIHSGGTTQKPKTVVHNNIAINQLADDIINTVYPSGDYQPHENMLMMLPIFHGFGLGVSVHTILTYMHMVLMPKFNANSAVSLIKKHKITHLAGVPSMYKKMMLSKNFQGDLQSISHIFCGGDNLSTALKNEFDKRLQQCGSSAELLEGYGLTETTSVFSLSLNGEVRENSQGKPLINNLIRVVDTNLNDVEVGEYGEFLLSTPSLMVGYLDSETNEAIFIDKNGKRWLKTGDIGRVDSDGYIYFKERAKRTIKISANNIFPSEIEQFVNTLPEIKDCCVARYYINGKPYTRLYIVVNKKHTFNQALKNKISKEIAKNIIKYAIPKEIILTDNIYRTPLGKVDYARYERELNDN